MPRLFKTLTARMAACGLCLFIAPPQVYGAEDAPLGAWRTTNDCFLTVFVLSEGGGALALYMSGEREDKAAWTWEGGLLKITSPSFPMDRFDAHLSNGEVRADYVWHDMDKDQLFEQACVFERFTSFGVF